MIEPTKQKGATINYIDEGQIEKKFQTQRGRDLIRRSVPGSKLQTGALSGEIPDNSVSNASMQDDAIKQGEWDFEAASIVISGTDTTGTATVTSGSIPIGYFLTSFTTPVASYVQLVVSSTTLTATLTTAPGAGNEITIRVVLLKA